MKTVIRKTKPVIFKNKDFQTIQVKLFFPFQRNKDELALVQLLPGMFHHVCNKYPTEREYRLQLQKLYILSCFCNQNNLINDCYFSFDFMVPDVQSLGKKLLEEQFQFISEILYNPKIENNSFCEEEFNREIENLKLDIQRGYQDNSCYASIKMREMLDPDGEYSQLIFNHPEQIDLATPEILYNFYLKTIYNNQPMIYIFGNVDKEEITELCNRYLYRVPVTKKSFSVQTRKYLPIRKPVSIVEKSDFRNSIYAVYYKVDHMSEKDELLLGAVQRLLNSQSSRILNKVLRDENDLVYSSYARSSFCYGFLGIITHINKKNIKQVKKAIQEVFVILKDSSIVGPALDNIKESNRISLIRDLDDKRSLFREKIIKDLKWDYSAKEYYQFLLEITPEDIITFVDRLVYDSEYFLEEGNHE